MFLAAEMMFFIGLLGAYIVLRSASRSQFEQQAMLLNKPLGAANTLVLLGSSVTMALAVSAAKSGLRGRLLGTLGLTVLLAVAFIVIDGFEPRGDMRQNLFWASYDTLAGVHAVHLIGGMIALLLLGAQAARGRLLPAATEYAAMFWHFVVGVWIVLFGLLYLM